MAHTLTAYGGDLVITVNGNDVELPYTLQNGDSILVRLMTRGESIKVNGEIVKGGTVVKLQDTDIEVTQTLEKGENRPSITINYTESGGGGQHYEV